MLDAALSVFGFSADSGLEIGLLCFIIITAIFLVLCLITTVLKITGKRKQKPTVSGGVVFLSYFALILSLSLTVFTGILAQDQEKKQK